MNKLGLTRKGYMRLATRGTEQEDFTDEQFVKPAPKFPVKAVLLAIFLFATGTLLLVFGSLIFTGYYHVEPSEDTSIPMLVVGSLVFLPGFYHVRIAYYAWKGYKGYSYDDIPEFD